MTSNYSTISFFAVTIILLFSHCEKKENSHFQEEENIPTQIISRDEAAHQIHYPMLQKALHKKGINLEEAEVFLRAFKQEQKLEIWLKEKTHKQHIFFKSYDFCQFSGQLGPKRKEGDQQIPEGLYHIDIFNPLSNFHLSLGINYPNESDKILSDKTKPGGDIYIHGGCMTIGCIPITDEHIKELYTLTNIARQNGQIKIPVHIFPFRMNQKNRLKWNSIHPEYAPFWENLQIFHDYFEYEKVLPLFVMTKGGVYERL